MTRICSAVRPPQLDASIHVDYPSSLDPVLGFMLTAAPLWMSSRQQLSAAKHERV